MSSNNAHLSRRGGRALSVERAWWDAVRNESVQVPPALLSDDSFLGYLSMWGTPARINSAVRQVPDLDADETARASVLIYNWFVTGADPEGSVLDDSSVVVLMASAGRASAAWEWSRFLTGRGLSYSLSP